MNRILPLYWLTICSIGVEMGAQKQKLGKDEREVTSSRKLKKRVRFLSADLEKVADLLAEGNLSGLPEKIEVDFRSLNIRQYQALIELARHSVFGQRVLKVAPEFSILQEARSRIDEGKFKQALNEIREFEAKNSGLKQDLQVDLSLEKARILVFLGRFTEVPPLLCEVTRNIEVSAVNRGVASQLTGHALLELGDLNSAEASFIQALELAEFSGNSMGTISARFFMSKLYGLQKRFDLAFDILDEGARILPSIANMRWYLGYYRHLAHLSFLAGRPSALDSALAAINVARSIGDRLFEYRSALDYHWMVRATGVSHQPDLQEMKSFAANSESDLKTWIETFELGQSKDQPQTLQIFLLLAHAGHLAGTQAQYKADQNYSWIYDSKLGLLLDLKNSVFFPLKPESSMVTLLKFLNTQQSPVHCGTAFENVWKITWTPERHQNVIDVCVSRLAKLSEAIKIVRADSMIELTSRGLIL